jgi:hypothetical protein
MKLNVKSKKKKKQVYKFKIGDHVRVSHQKRTFGKEVSNMFAKYLTLI